MMSSDRYRKSWEMLERARKVIPLGSQTFSKSYIVYPSNAAPLYLTHGRGARVWDVDGNEYVDFVNALASVTLGYSDPDVTAAVQAQLEQGVIFSLPHPIEMEVAEKICEMVPCAEMVRFGKNGSDATSGAIRLARAYTQRDRVAVCGYHGWQDWYIGSTVRNRGVPQVVRDLTHRFPYNDLPAFDNLLRTYPDQFAAVILEPMNVTEPAAGYLEGARDIAHRHGALLIFDETITGFRYANGGAQELFGVTPDLACFGKGLANGYPVSAVAGRADIMSLMEEIFFSFTFGGETLSLAAAQACMTKLTEKPVIAHMCHQGQKIVTGLRQLIARHGAGEFMAVSGHPTWSYCLIQDTADVTSWELKTVYLQEMLARGILTLGTHNMSYAHDDEAVEKLLRAYDEVIPLLVRSCDRAELGKILRCEPVEPVFRVR